MACTSTKLIYMHEEILKRDEGKCQDCGKLTRIVHHKTPIKDKGDVLDPENLVSLCNDCHKKRHAEIREANPCLSKKFKKMAFFISPEIKERIFLYVTKDGFNSKQSEAVNKLLDIGLKAEGY
jgi:hypothetical protein